MLQAQLQVKVNSTVSVGLGFKGSRSSACECVLLNSSSVMVTPGHFQALVGWEWSVGSTKYSVLSKLTLAMVSRHWSQFTYEKGSWICHQMKPWSPSSWSCISSMKMEFSGCLRNRTLAFHPEVPRHSWVEALHTTSENYVPLLSVVGSFHSYVRPWGNIPGGGGGSELCQRQILL